MTQEKQSKMVTSAQVILTAIMVGFSLWNYNISEAKSSEAAKEAVKYIKEDISSIKENIKYVESKKADKEVVEIFLHKVDQMDKKLDEIREEVYRGHNKK